ncbi:hypothetical protein CTI12_AA313570 [Artemisia annua]|uniref:Uncharacterized protein n=1 Tax=Artemisia annua TaxID=35608 RepID=A0A2U1N354_ARTAN|nr:hypothetical protein CTI12_AA313570 [Artemisia annua]
MSMATSGLAEAYVMRKHHQEKINTTLKGRGATNDSAFHDDDHVSSTIGCFPTLFKKVHPATSSIIVVSDHSSPRRHKS